jgi:hypothetical protein
VPEVHDADGRRIIIKAGQGDAMGTGPALNKVRIENERVAAWQHMEDRDRAMVQAVVRQALLRLLESPHWLPGSVRLGTRRLDVFLVIELDVDRVAATEAADDLDLAVSMARIELAETLEGLDALEEDPPPQ